MAPSDSVDWDTGGGSDSAAEVPESGVCEPRVLDLSVELPWQRHRLRLGIPRISTLLMLVAWVGVFVVYLWVRPG